MYRWIVWLVLFFPITAAAEDRVKVNIQKSTVYEEPRFFSGAVGSVRYGQELEKLGESRDWLLVNTDGGKGWIHRSAVRSTKVSLGAVLFGGGSAAPKEDEVALAGKGFTPEVERRYGESHPEMDYAVVDEIESFTVGQDSLRRFIEEGGLQVMEEQR
jgi:hypothetical protein